MFGHIPIGDILLRLMEDCYHWLFSHIQLVLCAQDAIHLHQPFGAKNTDELKNLRKKSTVIILLASFLMFVLGVALARPLTSVFVGYDDGLFALTLGAFTIYSFSFLFVGYNIFISSFFTALNNGAVSAAVSFLRVLLFQVLSVLTLPLVFGVDGIWFSVVVAEGVAMIMDRVVVFAFRNKYKY